MAKAYSTDRKAIENHALDDKFWDSKEISSVALDNLGALGFGFGLPTSQIQKTAGFWLQENPPEGVIPGVVGSVFGKNREGTLLNIAVQETQ
jgi:hypothetical protein